MPQVKFLTNLTTSMVEKLASVEQPKPKNNINTLEKYSQLKVKILLSNCFKKLLKGRSKTLIDLQNAKYVKFGIFEKSVIRDQWQLRALL